MSRDDARRMTELAAKEWLADGELDELGELVNRYMREQAGR